MDDGRVQEIYRGYPDVIRDELVPLLPENACVRWVEGERTSWGAPTERIAEITWTHGGRAWRLWNYPDSWATISSGNNEWTFRDRKQLVSFLKLIGAVTDLTVK